MTWEDSGVVKNRRLPTRDCARWAVARRFDRKPAASTGAMGGGRSGGGEGGGGMRRVENWLDSKSRASIRPGGCLSSADERRRAPPRLRRFATRRRPRHTVFFVSDGTGITAETFGNSILSQFAIKPRHLRRPFIDTPDKAHQVVREINHTAEHDGRKPIVFITLVNTEILSIVKEQSQGLVLDMFNTFIEPLEAEFGITSNHRIGRFSDVSESQEYTDRIEAINFSLAHDDGQSAKNLAEADVILVGVSRSGKTPTSLYLAMQHGIKAANYPLIPEDFERGKLPSTLAPFKAKCFGLTIDPDRLARIRNERRPNSKYASIENCRYEVREGEAMMKREGIAWLSSTHKSIEEIATTILRDLRPDRLGWSNSERSIVPDADFKNFNDKNPKKPTKPTEYKDFDDGQEEQGDLDAFRSWAKTTAMPRKRLPRSTRRPTPSRTTRPAWRR